jgi:uncharacterized membrane protein YfcA
MVAGVLGIGGGLLLIAILPALVPAAAIVPLHSATQLMSNASRALFALRSVDWRHVPRFLGGSLLGIVLFGALLYHISTDMIPLFIGSYILLNMWSRKFGLLLHKYESYFLAGVLQTGLGLVVGATGPLSMTVLIKDLGDKEKVVATSAMFMTITHICKIAFFGVFAFSFSRYAIPLLMLVAGALLGSWIGTLIRGNISGRHFSRILKLVLSLLALRMILEVILT